MEKNKLEFKDDFVESVLQNADHPILTHDFDNHLMQKIRANHAYKKEVLAKLKKSMFYFFVGIFLILLFPLISIIQRIFFQSSINTLSVFILFLSIAMTIIFMVNYKRLFQSITG